MSNDEDSDKDMISFQEVSDKIKQFKSNPDTASMFVSGWDDADEDVVSNKNPQANPEDHIVWAAEKGKLEIVKSLISTDPKLVNVSDGDGYTALHRASYENHLHIVSYLLSVNANIDSITECGWTPLHSAAHWNNYQIAARLLAANANPLALSKDGDQTPLHVTCSKSHCKSTLLLFLLREDAVDFVQQKNKLGETAEEMAKSHGMYAPLFEMVLPAATYIRSFAFTCNPYVRSQM